MKFETFLMFPYSFACRAKSIGTLFVEIGSMVKQLLLRVFFVKESPVATLKWNFGNFYVSHISACRSESIVMLLVKVDRTVKSYC